MIPRFIPEYSIDDFFYILKNLFGNPRNKFENKFAKLVNKRFAIFYPYGRTGLISLIKSLDINGKEIICPAYTCVVVPHAIVYSGNKPVFIDSQEYDFNMDISQIEEAISENTGAIIATSIFGYPVNLDKLKELSTKYPHIHIIQDCAHSFSASWKGLNVESVGVAAIYGLNISKTINSIFGGMVVTDDEQLYCKLKNNYKDTIIPSSFLKPLLRLVYFLAAYFAFKKPFYGIVNWLERKGILNSMVKYYDEAKIDMPHDYLEETTRIESIVGCSQIKKYDKIIKERRQCAKLYNEQLGKIEEIKLPPLIDGATYSHYVIRTNSKKGLIEFAAKEGVHLGELIEYCIPYMKVYYNEVINTRYNISGKWPKQTVNLPIHSVVDALTICKIIKRFFCKNRG